MPVNPHTGLYNITRGEFLDAVAATEDVPLTREDGTLTRAGQEYVADMRTRGHDDCEECHPGLYDPAPEGWEDYERVNDAQAAAHDAALRELSASFAAATSGMVS